MSAINGDKARFHRNRKAKIARRARKRQQLAADLQQQSGVKTSETRSARVLA